MRPFLTLHALLLPAVLAAASPLRADARAAGGLGVGDAGPTGTTGAAHPQGPAAAPPAAAQALEGPRPEAIWERVVEASDRFLGAPYRRSPLGEGSGIDPDPRWRTDAFDCLTLVETAIALGYGSGPALTERVLDDLRYQDGDAPSFQSRLHLMEAQWIPTLVRKGYLRDVTLAHGGEAVLEVAVELDEARWRRRAILRHLGWRQELEGAHALPVIPLEAAARLAAALPDGLILNVVRRPQPGRITFVTHTGLVILREGKRYVRHAALGERRVIDEPLDRFLARHARMRRWEVLGVNLLAIRDNSERVQALLQRSPTEQLVAGEDPGASEEREAPTVSGDDSRALPQ